jgi:hypothetical protein
MLCASAAARAATFQVTLTNGAFRHLPGCRPVHAAADIASAAAGDTVSVPAGTYPLNAATGGTIVIGHSITSSGPNGGVTPAVIDGHSAGGHLRGQSPLSNGGVLALEGNDTTLTFSSDSATIDPRYTELGETASITSTGGASPREHRLRHQLPGAVHRSRGRRAATLRRSSAADAGSRSRTSA